MPTLDERVAFLEGKVEEHSRGFGELRDMVFQLDTKVDRFRGELAGRLDGLDQKVDRFREELAARIDGLDHKMSTHFLWILGVQIAVLIAVIGALVGS